MSDPIDIWVIHNRAKDLDVIARSIRAADPTRQYARQIDTSEEWLSGDGTYQQVDGCNFVVLHEGILDHPEGLRFFEDKRGTVENWIIVSGYGRYRGKIIDGPSGQKSDFPECDFHWSEFIRWYSHLKHDLKRLTATLCFGEPPWRHEFFLEVTLRLLCPDPENASSVRHIIGLDDRGGSIEGEYERLSDLNEDEIYMYAKVKSAVAELLDKQSGHTLVSPDAEAASLYSFIHKSLYELQR